MLKLDSISLDYFMRVYVLANTPSYLYRNYYADFSLQGLSELENNDDLLGFIDNSLQQPEIEFSVGLKILLCIVLLAHKQTRIPTETVKGLQESKIRWIREFLEEYFASLNNGDVKVINLNEEIHDEIVTNSSPAIDYHSTNFN